MLLKRHGYESETVSDGKTALERVRTNRPTLIFADLTIKGMSGEALCNAIKAEESTRGIPVIVLSGDRDIAEKADSCGANGHLGKPFEFDDLMELVRKYVDDESR